MVQLGLKDAEAIVLLMIDATGGLTEVKGLVQLPLLREEKALSREKLGTAFVQDLKPIGA